MFHLLCGWCGTISWFRYRDSVKRTGWYIYSKKWLHLKLLLSCISFIVQCCLTCLVAIIAFCNSSGNARQRDGCGMKNGSCTVSWLLLWCLISATMEWLICVLIHIALIRFKQSSQYRWNMNIIAVKLWNILVSCRVGVNTVSFFAFYQGPVFLHKKTTTVPCTAPTILTPARHQTQ